MTTLLLLISLLKICLGDEYSELVRSEVGVRILPLIVELNSTDYFGNNCSLTLHRESCVNRALREHDRVSWSTKVCFLWKCDMEEHAMRVGACWIGSKKNPVTIIKPDGCTQESAIIRSPLYLSATSAMSIGWLSVREQGMTHVNVQCSIKLCHQCEEECSKNTPPRICKDVTPRTRDYDRVWNNTAIQDLCTPPSSPPQSSSFQFSTTSAICFIILRVIL